MTNRKPGPEGYNPGSMRSPVIVFVLVMALSFSVLDACGSGEPLPMTLRIEVSGGAAYEVSYQGEPLQDGSEDRSIEFTVPRGEEIDATVVKSAGRGEVTVRLVHEGEVLYRETADEVGEAVYLVYNTSDLDQ